MMLPEDLTGKHQDILIYLPLTNEHINLNRLQGFKQPKTNIFNDVIFPIHNKISKIDAQIYTI